MAIFEIDNRPALIDFECNNDAIMRTVQNAKNLIMCRMGEVPYDRYRGFDPALFDLPLPQMQEKLMPELDRVLLWEPDCEVISATCTIDDDDNVIIKATIEVFE